MSGLLDLTLVTPNAGAQRRAERSKARPLGRVVGLDLPSVELTLDTAGTSVRLASKSFP